MMRNVFDEIRIFGQRRVLDLRSKRINAVNSELIASKIICKVYDNKIREGLNKINGCKEFCNVRNH